MNIEEMIKKIVENGNINDMEELSDMLEDTMEIIQDYDEKCYKDFEMKLYKMAYGNVLNEEMACEIVSKMRPYGERWTIEETRKIEEERGINSVSPIDFYVVINSMYNDYYNLFNDSIEEYVRLTMSFIQDEDAKQDKVFLYYTIIPQ